MVLFGVAVKKSALLTSFFITGLLLVATNAQISNVAIANFSPYTVFLPAIVIKSNGSVTPETEFINHTGNVYTLTSDIINYSLVIQRSNITLDGKGRTLKGSYPSPYMIYSTGLSLDHVTNVTVRDLEITGFNDYDVFRIKSSSGSSIIRVKTSSIHLESSYANTIAESTIASINMEYSENNILIKNVIGKLYQFVSHNNLVTKNNITNLIVQFSDSNKYYANNFLSPDNSFQYYSSNKESFWDNGSIGNYWSDYLARFPNASEIGSSGIGNTPYAINNKAWINGELVEVTWIRSNIVDHYPLMAPFDEVAPSIKVILITNKSYDTSTVPLNFTINERASQIAYSLDGKENVTVMGNVTLTDLSNGLHDITVYANDTFGNMGASETISFTVAVPEPFPVVPIAAASVAVAVAACAGLLLYRKRQREAEQA